jgi:hypothetical protein
MSHYDCSDCGAYEGVAYGSCSACTPREVFLAEKEYNDAVKLANQEFNRMVSEERMRFVEHATSELRDKWQELYNKYKPKERK